MIKRLMSQAQVPTAHLQPRLSLQLTRLLMQPLGALPRGIGLVERRTVKRQRLGALGPPIVESLFDGRRRLQGRRGGGVGAAWQRQRGS